MSEIEKLKNLKIPEHLRGKKLVMSAEMFVDEIGEVLFYFTQNLIPGYDQVNDAGKKLVIKQYVIGYLDVIYQSNIDSKPDDPEELS